jgi:excisionase family DNA binding protein
MLNERYSADRFVADLADRVAERVESRLQKMLNGVPRIQPRLLTIEQAAQYIGRSKEAVEQMVFNREWPVIRKGRRVHIERERLDEWIERNRV